MPPPRLLPSSRNRCLEKVNLSTSSNASHSRSGSSSISWGSVKQDHNSNLSSNSDAHKPRQKRRPKKKKQVIRAYAFNKMWIIGFLMDIVGALLMLRALSQAPGGTGPSGGSDGDAEALGVADLEGGGAGSGEMR